MEKFAAVFYLIQFLLGTNTLKTSSLQMDIIYFTQERSNAFEK